MGQNIPLDDDSVTPRPMPTRRPWQISVRGLMTLIFGLACGLALLTVMGRAVGDAREAGRRAQCLGNLCHLQLALLNYHEAYGELPPGYVADATGRPMHSWRVLILPFLEQTALYNQYDFREPWNGPNNITLLNRMPLIFSCPSRFSSPTNLTSFVAITGPGTMFPGAASVRFADVTDGPARTLMMVEVNNQNIPWTAPVDLDVRTMSLKVNDPSVPGISSTHPHGAHICLGESRHFLREEVSADALRALITIAGRDGVGYDDGSQSY
jgi:hypothetical protein